MDYNIYIHSVGGATQQNQTYPWQVRQQTYPWSASQGEWDNLETPEYASASASSFIKTALPKLAAAIIVTKIAFTVYSNVVLPVLSAETGDYRLSVENHNVKNALSWLFNPAGHAFSTFRTFQSERLNDMKKAQYRLLLGDSDINQYAGKGV